MVCVPLRYGSVTLESKFRVRGAMRGNDGRDAVTGAGVRVRVSKDLIFDCGNANTPLHGKSIDPRFLSLSRFSSLS